MQSFDYSIQDEIGIHARPAGMLVKKAKEFSSKATIRKDDGASADLTKLLAVMSLGVKCGDKVTVTVEGEDEVQAAKELEQFFKENL